ncbi:MAG: hypothetical protein VXZ96_07015 [Myxococcota bacterium]|nr:hypothetical protein [Myxococcota bacterium]
MLGLGLLLSVALAEDPTPTTDLLDVQSNEISDTDEALYKRLLQDDQPRALSESQILDVSSTEVELPWWGYPLGMFALLALGVMVRRQGLGMRSPEKVKVLSRATLGREGSLAVVEAPSANGSVRRMLIGYGAGSAPRLVADLGAQDGLNLEADAYKPLDMVIDDEDDDILSQREDMINSVLAARKRNARSKSSSVGQTSMESSEDPWVKDFQKLLAEQLNDNDGQS